MLTPLNNNVIIKRTQKEEKSAGGIVLPDSEQEQPTTGVVIACGVAAKNIAAGDIVVFGKYAGKKIKVGNEALLIMQYDELIAKL